jgi:hypothetical protein
MEASMNDVSLLPDTSSSSSTNTSSGGPPTPTGGQSQYTFGLISAQIDFTIIQSVNGGPTWTLSYFKGPGGASQGLFNFGRTVIDKLNISFDLSALGRNTGLIRETTARGINTSRNPMLHCRSGPISCHRAHRPIISHFKRALSQPPDMPMM